MTETKLPQKSEQSSALLRRWSASTRSRVYVGLVFQLCAMVGWILIAYGVGHAVGGVLEGQNQSQYLLLALAGIGLRVIGVWAAEEVLGLAGHRMRMTARQEILTQLSATGAGWLAGQSAGARVSQIIDRTEKLTGYTANWLPGIYLSVLGPIIILIAVAVQSWLSAVLLAISVLVLPVFIWLTAMQTAAEARSQQSALDALSGSFQSRAAQAGIIRAFRAIGREQAALGQASEDLRTRTMAILRVAFLSTAVLEFFASVSIALVAVYIGFKLLGVFPFNTHEHITLTEGLTVLILAPEFFAPIRKLSSLHHDRSDARAAADFFAPWLAAGKSRTADILPTLTSAPHIHFEGVEIGWPGAPSLPAAFTFSATPGTITALSGPSGSGKSTLLSSLLGQTELRTGQLLINDKIFSSDQSLANSIAYVSQTPWLMEGSIFENIRLARPDASIEDIEAAAERVGLLTLLNQDRQGLDTLVQRMGSGLSGGQRQRIALARALVRNAPIWLLDEPTAHLDPDSEQAFCEIIKGLRRGRTIIMASHSPILLSIADRTIQMPALQQEARP